MFFERNCVVSEVLRVLQESLLKFAGIVDLFLLESRPKVKRSPPLFHCRNNPLEELRKNLYSCVEVVCCNIKKVVIERWRNLRRRYLLYK